MKISSSSVIKTALIDASLTTIYIAAVSLFLSYGQKTTVGQNSALIFPITLLLLFVLSAAVTGFLVFGRPLLWYLDGNKKEALSLLSLTLGIFLIITLIAIFLLFFFS